MFSLSNLQIKHSARIIITVLIILTSGLWILYATAISTYLFLGMTVIGCISTGHFILKHGLVALPNSIVRCDANPSALYLTQKNGFRFKVIPKESSFMSPHLLLLTWVPDQEISRWKSLFTLSKLVILNADNVSSREDFRRLRVLLAFRKPKSS